MKYKYTDYIDAIYETSILENQTEPPYDFIFIAKKLLENEYHYEELIYLCWQCMRKHIQGTNVSAQKVDELFGERLKEIIVNRKIKEMEEDFK